MVFWFLVGLYILPIWIFAYFPTLDGPSHVYNARIIAEYDDPDQEILRKYYDIDIGLIPNLSGHILLAGLQSLVAPVTSEKILLTLHVFLLATAFRFAIRSIDPQADSIALFAFPFVYPLYLHLGLYNYALGLSCFLLSLGYWLRHRSDFRWGNQLTFFVLISVTFFCHLLPYLMAFGSLIVLAFLLPTFRDWGHRDDSVRLARWKRDMASGLAPLLWFTPTLIQAVRFLSQSASSDVDYVLYTRILKLVSFGSMWVFDWKELLLSIVPVGFVVVISAYVIYHRFGSRKVLEGDAILALGLVYAALVILAPDRATGGAVVVNRLVDYPYLAVFLWLAGQRTLRRVHHQIITAGLIVALSIFAVRAVKYAELQAYIEEYLSVTECVPRHSTLLPLVFSHGRSVADGGELSDRINPFGRLSAYIAARRDAIDLSNYEAQLEYFPTQFRREVDRSRHISALPLEQQLQRKGTSRATLLRELNPSGGESEYIYAWGFQTDDGVQPAGESILSELEQAYEVVCTSRPRGVGRLYRRRASAE